MIDVSTLKRGDVLVTATHDVGGWLIRLRSKLQGKPSLHNHVAVFTHCDTASRARGLEGRPGGFGWADLTEYINHPATITNSWQPARSDADRAVLVDKLTAMVGTPYDWYAITMLGAELLDQRAARLAERIGEFKEGRPPSHVMCASAIDWAYEDRGWPNPGGLEVTRWTDVDDWTSWITEHGWQKPPVTS